VTRVEKPRPYAYDEARAARVAPLMRDLVQCALDAVRSA
jgi:N-formylglutamate deformylase